MQERQDEFQTSGQQNRNQEIINNNNYLNKQAYYKWCQAGTDAREMISKAREELEKTKLRTQTSNFNRDDSARFERDVENAKKKLKYAEDSLSHLEKEARIKDIRPGWIRCQYE